MAKPNKNGEKTVDISVPADFTIEAHGLTLTVADLEAMSPKGLSYLLANGYKQSLTDAAAFTKDQKSGKSGAELQEMADSKRKSRHEAILNGSVGTVSGSRATPIERVMEEVTIARLRALCVSKGVPMLKNTKDVKALDAGIKAYQVKFGADVKAEAEARIAADQAAVAAAGDILG
jgi:hypothetical protein